jgi:hypothetical protein
MMKKVFVKMMVMMILKFYLMYNSIFHLVDLFAKIDRSDEQKCEPFFLKDERKNDWVEPRFGSLPSDGIKRNFIFLLSELIDRLHAASFKDHKETNH